MVDSSQCRLVYIWQANCSAHTVIIQMVSFASDTDALNQYVSFPAILTILLNALFILRKIFSKQEIKASVL